jgi:hypothetical protein
MMKRKEVLHSRRTAMRVTFAYEPHQPLGRQAFLSTKFGLPLVEDGVVAACVIDEPPGPDPDEDTEAGA